VSVVFRHVTLGQRVLFASGSAAANVAAEVAGLGASRVMMIASESGRGVAAAVMATVDVVLRWDEVVQHVPVETAAAARAAAAAARVDAVVCVGGGSATGLAKAVALTTGLPIVAVPTTYAGSEATNVWGMTEASRKTTGADDRVLPVSVVYDPVLTYSLPVDLSVASGLNAAAHCVDSLWAPRADPINAAMAVEGLRAMAAGLPQVKADPSHPAGREAALYGSYLSAVAFASAGSGMHHKICHVLGGAYNLPHAQTHAIVLPYVLAFNQAAAPEASTRIAAALGAETASAGLNHLYDVLDGPRALRDVGLAEKDIAEAAALALAAIPASNPRPVTAENLEVLLRFAWAGEPPETGTV
jgi:maleylacetate reductase